MLLVLLPFIEPAASTSAAPLLPPLPLTAAEAEVEVDDAAVAAVEAGGSGLPRRDAERMCAAALGARSDGGSTNGRLLTAYCQLLNSNTVGVTSTTQHSAAQRPHTISNTSETHAEKRAQSTIGRWFGKYRQWVGGVRGVSTAHRRAGVSRIRRRRHRQCAGLW